MWEIYSIGNATFLIEVFRGIARLWSTNDVYVLLSIGLLLGLIWNSLLWAVNQDKSPFPAKGFIVSLIFVMGLLGPQSLVDVRITSKRDMSFQEVNNVPLLPALGGWLITNSGTAVADLMAQAFSIVGIANTWEALSPIQHFVNLDEVNYTAACTPTTDKSVNVCSSFSSYLEDCYTTANMISPESVPSINAVMDATPRDIMSQLKVTNPKIYTTSYMVAGSAKGEQLTCPNAWTKLDSMMKGSVFQDNLQKKLITQGADLDKVSVFLSQNSMQGTLPNAESSLELANAAFLKSVFMDYFPNSEYGQQVSRAMFDTVKQRQLANATKKEYWMENAEVMQSFFEALTVFLTPFIGLALAVSGQGLMAVGQYFAAWVFVQLWSIMIVLVNLFTALAMTNRFTNAVAAGKSQFSLSAIDSQFATANSYISISGMLYTFIPAICVFVLYRGVHAMQGMAKQAMADPSIDSKRLSPDTGTSMQNGNAHFGNHTSEYQNNTGEFFRGDSMVKTSMGSTNVGQSASAGLTAGQQSLNSQAASKAASAQTALNDVFSNNQGAGLSFNDTQTTSFTASNASEWASSAAKAISDTGVMSYKEAQQLVASGAVSMDAGGQLSLGGKSSGGSGMFGSLGAKFGADLKASVGLGTNADQTTQQNYQRNLQNAQNQSEKINANLSKIRAGSEVLSASSIDGFQKSVQEAASYSRQAQALTQQSTALSGLLTDSKQLSRTQEIDNSAISNQLRNQSIASFMTSQNPDLWDRIKNSTIDGKSGGEYLQERESAHLNETSSKSVNPGGDARALALMDFVKANDAIDIDPNKNGIDTSKEKQDAQTNRDIFKTLSNVGVTNAGSASEFYDKQANVLAQIEAGNKSFDEKNAELSLAAPAIPSASNFTNDAGDLKTSTASNIDNGTKEAKGAQERAEQAKDIDMPGIKSSGEKLTGGEIPSVSATGVKELNKNINELKDNQDSNQSTLGLAKNVIPAATEVIKPGGAAAFNNMVEQKTLAGEDISSYKPEYAQGIDALSHLDEVKTGSMNDRLTSRYDDKVESAQSMISVLNNDKLMTDILGKNESGSYGEGTESSKNNFDKNTLEMLSKGANWLQDYKSDAAERPSNEESKTPAIDEAIKRSESEKGDGVATYLSAMQNLGLAREADKESDGKVFSSATEKAASDLSKVLEKQETGGNRNYLLAEVSGDTEITSGSFWIPSGDRESTRDEISTKLDHMEKIASRMDHMLTPEQKEYVSDFVNDARSRIKEDVGDRPGQDIGGKDDGYLSFVGSSSADSKNETSVNVDRSSSATPAASEQGQSNASVTSAQVASNGTQGNITASSATPAASEQGQSNASVASAQVASNGTQGNITASSATPSASEQGQSNPSVAPAQVASNGTQGNDAATPAASEQGQSNASVAPAQVANNGTQGNDAATPAGSEQNVNIDNESEAKQRENESVINFSNASVGGRV